MNGTRISSGGLALSLMIALGALGCGARQPDLPHCAIERPGLEMTLEQAAEADRAAAGERPLLPATYEWLKRLDRDIGLWGDAE
jgi:hypothetical protein